jgi:transposase-like protein
MPSRCLKCELNGSSSPRIVRSGHYYRASDGKWIQRFKCQACKAGFSLATFQKEFRQKKRHKNEMLRKLLSGGMSQRRAAKVLNLNRVTVVRKFLFLELVSELRFKQGNLAKPKARIIEFDDLETFEHTKCKPISVTLAVEHKTRRILGFEVSSMPAKGRLVEKAKKYGYRKDGRRSARRKLFKDLQSLVEVGAEIKSDANPHYPNDVIKFFPESRHKRYLGKRGSLGGQGELKKTQFDPLFSLNHTCAMFRANVNRLFRKTWCTTKKMERLRAHLMIYACFHNESLIPQT